jgi:hypothetical protein
MTQMREKVLKKSALWLGPSLRRKSVESVKSVDGPVFLVLENLTTSKKGQE